MCNPTIQKYGANPAHIQWVVVRGDTATLKVEFLDADETTYFDTTGWNYQASAYEPAGDFLDALQVNAFPGYVIITAPATVTTNWGKLYRTVVAELPFDLQVTIPGTGNQAATVWTPVLGTICVLGDITPGGSL